MAYVLLFDIDGTLVLTGGAGRRAMVGAFRKAHARDDVFEGTSFAGMTDRAIARHGLRALGDSALDHPEAMDQAIDHVLDEYLALLEVELDRGLAGYEVLPGVRALLASIVGRSDVAIGLGTGNVRRGAYAKLMRGDLHGTFAFGGFGCDAEDRVELLRVGAERGAAALGRPREACRVVVIGDTPKDVAAAQGLGAPCIGVGTGSYTVEDLARSGADRTFATLAEPGVHAALFEVTRAEASVHRKQ